MVPETKVQFYLLVTVQLGFGMIKTLVNFKNGGLMF